MMNKTLPKGSERYDGLTYVDLWAARITGQLKVVESNTFIFFLSSDDGSALWLDGSLVIDNDGRYANNGGTGGALRMRPAHVYLDKGMHQLRVEYFQHNGTNGLTLEYAAPGIYRRPLPATLLFLPGADCCICACQNGQCRLANTTTHAIDCLWPSESGPTSHNQPIGRSALPDQYDQWQCEHPCEDPGAANYRDPREHNPYNNYKHL